MEEEQEVIQLRSEAASLLQQVELQGRAVTPEEDARILELLKNAAALERRNRPRKKIGCGAYLTISRAAL